MNSFALPDDICKGCGRFLVDDDGDTSADILLQANERGVESLTEAQQAVYNGIFCGDCYDKDLIP